MRKTSKHWRGQTRRASDRDQHRQRRVKTRASPGTGREPRQQRSRRRGSQVARQHCVRQNPVSDSNASLIKTFYKACLYRRAARMITERREEFYGYEILSSVAEALSAKHPITATIPRRAMIDLILERTHLTRYKNAARHLAECAVKENRSMDLELSEAGIGTHQAYLARLNNATARRQASGSASSRDVDQTDCNLSIEIRRD